MYINFWYPLEESKNLSSDKPVQVKALGQKLVLFRDEEGVAHCLHDVCIHRGGALSFGKVQKNTIECPYHGWRFNGKGQCTKIPSLGKSNQKIPGRAKVDSYPTKEHYGLVFVFLGDLPEDQRPPILLPENNHYDFNYNEPQWRFVTGSWSIKANYERCIENGVDPAHNEFVHPRHGFGGANDDYYVPEHTLNNHDWGNSWGIDYFGPPNTHEILQRNETTRKESGYLKVYSGYHGANQLFTYIHITKSNFLHQYIWETPIDEYNTRAFLINFSNFMDEDIADDDEILDMNLVIADDDVQVLEPLDPIKTPKTMTQELMMPADKCIVAYRESLKGWAAKGWRIDSKKVAEANDEKTYAIPSPQRREQKGWILDQVPLIYSE